MGESIFEGTITKWLKQPGEKVQRDEPLFEISTDKVDAEIPAPASGTLSEIKVQAGNTVQVNTIVGVIAADGDAAAAAPKQQASAPAAQAAPQATQAQAAQPPSGEEPIPADLAEDEKEGIERQEQGAVSETGEQGRVRSSPLVRKIAKENNVNLAQVPGTGLGGRITKEDIEGFISKYGKGGAAAPAQPAAPAAPQQPAYVPPAPALAPAAAAPAMPAQTGPMQPVGGVTPGEVVPMSVMRKKIAEHMVMSKRTSAHVHGVFEVDVTRIVKIRERRRHEFEKATGMKLTFTPFFARAAVHGIRKWPIINSSVEGENIRYHASINLGIAVALDWGLIVPVVKNAEERSFVGLQKAIINQPQVAIMGVGGIVKKPVVVTDADGADSIAIRSMMHLSIGYDHRIIDGAVADQFMADVKKYLENWNEEIL
jgi:2-oxoglutarate dehydrogenase E2 component (dihydrolipoamide succinyltransferase)